MCCIKSSASVACDVHVELKLLKNYSSEWNFVDETRYLGTFFAFIYQVIVGDELCKMMSAKITVICEL
jgi:hypothetical protein